MKHETTRGVSCDETIRDAYHVRTATFKGYGNSCENRSRRKWRKKKTSTTPRRETRFFVVNIFESLHRCPLRNMTRARHTGNERCKLGLPYKEGFATAVLQRLTARTIMSFLHAASASTSKNYDVSII